MITKKIKKEMTSILETEVKNTLKSNLESVKPVSLLLHTNQMQIIIIQPLMSKRRMKDKAMELLEHTSQVLLVLLVTRDQEGYKAIFPIVGINSKNHHREGKFKLTLIRMFRRLL